MVFLCFSLPQNIRADNWDTVYKSNQRNAVIASTKSLDLEARWTRKAGDNFTFKAPVYQDGVFYFTEKSSTVWLVYAVEKMSGRELWRTSGTGLVVSEIAISKEYIVIPTKSLICLDIKNGSKIWEKPNPYNLFYFSHPTIYSDVIYVWNIYGNNGNVSAYNITDGSPHWQNNFSILGSGFYPFSIYEGNIVVLYSSGNNYSNITLIDTSGVKVWNTISIPRNASGPIIVSGNYGFLSTISGSISKIDLTEGKELLRFNSYANATPVVARNGNAYFLATSQYSIGNGKSYIFNWNYDGVDPPFEKNCYDDFRISASDNVVLFGDELVFANNKGQIVSYNIVNDKSKIVDLVPGNSLSEIMVGDDIFVAMDDARKNLYFAIDINSSIKSTVGFEVESPYGCADCNQYLGQLHSHYIPDNPVVSSSAFAVEEKYKNAGYDFIALTEHNVLTPSPGVDGILHIQDSEENTQSYFKNHIIGVGIDNLVSINLTDQERINGFYNQNGYTILAHPNLFIYRWKLANMLRLKNYNSIEIYNSAIGYPSNFTDSVLGINNYNYFSKSFALDDWDELLTRGKKVWGTANDDYTPGNPGFDGGAVMVTASENTQEAILGSLKSGQFYSMQGSSAPRLQISVENNTIRVVSDQISEIKFIGNEGKELRKERAVRSSSYQITGNEKYIRAEAYGTSKKKSWTQPVFVNDTESVTAEWIGKNRIEFLDAILTTNSSGAVSGTILKNSEYPKELPPMGLYSPIYKIESSGKLVEGADFEISYAKESAPFSDSALSLFSFDSENNAWIKVPSTVNIAKKTISAKLKQFSLYTLSSDMDDTEGPRITFQDNQTFTKRGFSTAQLNIGVVDESKIMSVFGYLDQKEFVFEDTNAEDGFNNILYLSKYTAGKHTLTLVATDYSGNVTENTYTMNILSNIRSIINVDELLF